MSDNNVQLVRFDPQPDLTAYELVCIQKLVVEQLTYEDGLIPAQWHAALLTREFEKDMLAKFPEDLLRHFKDVE